ncbi:hypothetical protein AB0A60_32550 [Streptomyces sp. NPDC046275]|uniref:hypothetical protein n=1 Tax=Streptomyces sp. NPDC046275 TaxID=3157201 RepID=UPI0033FD852F
MVTVRHTRTPAAALVVLALALTGCTNTGADAKPPATTAPTTTAAPTTAPADPQAAEKTAVLAAFEGMWAERTKATAKADSKGTALRKYTTLDALSKIENNLARMREAGIVIRGGLGHSGTTVTALDMTPKTPKATVTTCVDLSTYERYKAKEKRPIPLPTNQPVKYIATATMQKWPNGWMVTDYTPHGDRQC